jgi:hypothetical protein
MPPEDRACLVLLDDATGVDGDPAAEPVFRRVDGLRGVAASRKNRVSISLRWKWLLPVKTDR